MALTKIGKTNNLMAVNLVLSVMTELDWVHTGQSAVELLIATNAPDTHRVLGELGFGADVGNEGLVDCGPLSDRAGTEANMRQLYRRVHDGKALHISWWLLPTEETPA